MIFNFNMTSTHDDRARFDATEKAHDFDIAGKAMKNQTHDDDDDDD